MVILGIDPGSNTGLAVIRSGKLERLDTIDPYDIEMTLIALQLARVVFEDSRLQSHTWTRTASSSAAAKMARNVGEVDAWCKLIVGVCARLGIAAHGISPRDKGPKVNAQDFAAATGWTARSNEHERDACMVAWPYRRLANG